MGPAMPAEDKEHALAIVKHYWGLIPMTQETRTGIKFNESIVNRFVEQSRGATRSNR